MKEASDGWLSDDEQSVWRRLLAVEFHLHERLDQDLNASHGISLGDYGVLVHLNEAPGKALRMSDLADRVLISRSGLTRRVDAMERRGLVERRRCPADGRGWMAQLTTAGAEVLQAAAPTHVAGVRKYLVDALGCLEGLSEGITRVEHALG